MVLCLGHGTSTTAGITARIRARVRVARSRTRGLAVSSISSNPLVMCGSSLGRGLAALREHKPVAVGVAEDRPGSRPAARWAGSRRGRPWRPTGTDTMVLRAARAPGNIASPERVRRATELMGRFMGAVTAGLSAIDAHRVARVVHEDFFFVGTACGE